MVSTYLLPCLWACLACFGFAIIFNVHGVGAWIACLGGGLGWVVYLLAGKTILAAFLAAIGIGLYAEAAARLRRCPVTGYVVLALLPLVPGGGIYHAMAYALEGETELFMDTLFETLGIAAALAVGSMLSSSLFRTVYGHLRHSLHKPPKRDGKRTHR